MKFGLENISKLCDALDNPQRAFPSILVAGTNGKGSVTAMVHRALLAAGHRAARYTSPHLERFEERYVVGAREVETASLEAAARTVRDSVEALQRSGAFDAPPTFFECATALAFELFRREEIDLAVLEVGLGGRLDATNVVTPIAAAITSIAIDHQAQLGDTLEAIAFEKAGVIKDGIPVVCGILPPAAEAVIRDVCARRSARLVRAADCVDLDRLCGGARLSLPGAHQRTNAQVAACLLREVNGVGIGVDDTAVRAGVTEVEWPGRLERFVHERADVLIDAAHNPAGAAALAAHLREIGWTDCAVVFGVMQDKDAKGMLAELVPVCRALICTTPASSRALPADALAEIARAVPGARWAVSAAPDVRQAVEAATRAFSRVAVAGSIFLIGPVRGILRSR